MKRSQERERQRDHGRARSRHGVPGSVHELTVPCDAATLCPCTVALPLLLLLLLLSLLLLPLSLLYAIGFLRDCLRVRSRHMRARI